MSRQVGPYSSGPPPGTPGGPPGRRRHPVALAVALALLIVSDVVAISALVLLGLDVAADGETLRATSLIGTGAALLVISAVLIMLVRNPPRGHRR